MEAAVQIRKPLSRRGWVKQGMHTPPGQLFINQYGSVNGPEDVERYAAFLRSEAGIDGEPPVDLAAIFQRFGAPTPKRVALAGQQGVLLDPEAGLILIEERDRPTRQRFTEAHELMEMLFAAMPTRPNAYGRDVGNFKHLTKERLCNAGAAELLMPSVTFLPRVQQLGVSFDTARMLAVEYEVSLAASLIRMAIIGPGRHAAVLWRMKNKPSEIKSQVPENQLALIEMPAARIARQKLRVVWSFSGEEGLFIPKDKSVSDDTLVYAAWCDHCFLAGTNHLDLGTVQGIFYSENQPFEAEEDWQVISLLHLPGDAGCGR